VASNLASNTSSVEFEEDVRGSCAPYMRILGEGATALHVCPILNGIWTSFLDVRRWRSYATALSSTEAARIAEGMRQYDAVGMSTWIGEDFDERVLSALEAHAAADSPPSASPAITYSIIVERGHEVTQGLDTLEARLGPSALHWVQLGPPALEHLPEYRIAHIKGRIRHLGVEDFTLEMLQQFASTLPLTTVQQEINLLVRPSDATLAFCREHGCRFVAYGPLLGGMLSDRYLGTSAPTPDVDHSKQLDYLGSIQAWGGWERFQRLLRTLRTVGDAHLDAHGTAAPVAVVALAYILQLPYVLAAIVGVRLGGVMGADHRRDSLRALALILTPEEKALIERQVRAGVVLDGLART